MSDLTLRLSADQVNYIGNALALRPYGEVAPIIAKIQAQINSQLQPSAEEKKPETEPVG